MEYDQAYLDSLPVTAKAQAAQLEVEEWRVQRALLEKQIKQAKASMLREDKIKRQIAILKGQQPRSSFQDSQDFPYIDASSMM